MVQKLRVVTLKYLGERGQWGCSSCHKSGRYETRAVVGVIPVGMSASTAFKEYLYSAPDPKDKIGYLCANCAEILDLEVER